MASRHRSRELAVQMIYQWEFDPQSLGEPRLIQRFWEEHVPTTEDNRGFFEVLVRGVADYLPRIDAAIEEFLQNWRLARVEKVDLAVLRVAVFELLFERNEKTDLAVIINEAVEISKKFGTKESPAFVNGILDSLAKKGSKESQ